MDPKVIASHHVCIYEDLLDEKNLYQEPSNQLASSMLSLGEKLVLMGCLTLRRNNDMQELFNLDGEVVATSNGQWRRVGHTKVFHWYCESGKHLHVDPELASSCCDGECASRDKAVEHSWKEKEIRHLDNNWVEIALFSNCDLD